MDLHEENWSDVFLCTIRTRHEWYLMSTTCSSVQEPATVVKFWIHIAKLVVIKRVEALHPRLHVVYLGLEYRSVQDSDRTGFAVKLTAKYVDGWLGLVQFQDTKPVVTPLKEQKSANSHDETTARDQVQHALFRC